MLLQVLKFLIYEDKSAYNSRPIIVREPLR